MLSKPHKTSPKLLALLEKAKAEYESMNEAQKKEMHERQRESYVRAEMSWPETTIIVDGNKT